MRYDRRRPRGTRLMLLAPPLLFAALNAAQARLTVVATTPDYGALAQSIGGTHVSIKVLAKATEDPHFVDAKPSHIVTLNRADVLIESGADLELGWLPPLVAGARNAKVLPGGPGRVAGSSGVTLLDVPATLDRSQGDIHALGNPHFLMDPDNAVVVAAHLAQVFCGQDPKSCAAYRANLEQFKQRLEDRVGAWEERLAPYRGRSIVTYHNTWRYFARRFGLQADLFLEPKPGIPPSPPHMARVISQMREEGLRVILVEPFQSSKIADAVAKRADAEVVPVCQFPGGLTGTDRDYIALMDANVEAIAGALSRH